MKRLGFWLVLIAMMGLSWMVFGQDLPGGVVDPNAATDGLTDAIGGHNWGLAVAFGLMVLLWIGQKVYKYLKKDEANKDWLPIMAVVLAGIGGLTASYVANLNWLQAIGACVMAVVSALGTYDVIHKTKKLIKERKDNG